MRSKVKRSPLVRFLAKVERTDSGCWVWRGAIARPGYGRFFLGTTVQWAHRCAYILLIGPIPKGTEIDHLCRNLLCVNPEHLEAVSHRENVRRGNAGKNWSAKTHCPQGHTYTDENTYRWNNMRFCRTCQRGYKERYKQRVRLQARDIRAEIPAWPGEEGR